MSFLLDRNPHRVTVTPMRTVKDSMGSTVVPGDPIDLEVFIQPLSSDEQADLGLQSKTTCRVIGREGWPEGVSAKVLITKGPYQGRTFDQEGEPRRFGMSPRIYHYDVLITSRGTEVP